jgi:hypothetical protein
LRRRLSEVIGDLQDEDGQTQETGQASARELGGTGRGDRGPLGGRDRAGTRGLGGNGDGLGAGAVVATAGLALDDLGRVDGLRDRARAVGDGQGGSLGDCPGLATVGDLSGLRAIGSQSSHHLSSVSDVAVPVGGNASSGGGNKGDGGELHFD